MVSVFLGPLYNSVHYASPRGEWSSQGFSDWLDYRSGTSQETCFVENTLANSESYSWKIVFG